MTLKNFFTGRAIVLIILLVLAGIVAGFYSLNSYIFEKKQGYSAADYKNAEYIIGGNMVRLTNGVSEVEAAPGSASKIVTTYFGNELKTDLNSDGREDVVFLLTQQPGGSGTFYYVVAALNTERGYVGSQAYLLGDRIAPQTTEKGTGKMLVVNYTDRAVGEDFSVQPSVGKTVWLILDTETMQFGTVEQNFEGEANPSTMSLGMKTWVWESALYNDGTKIIPKQAGKFSILFGNDGKFTASTDCNSMGGSYTLNQSEISMTNIYSTKMACEGSQEADFAKILGQAQIYHFTSKGELVFDLKFDSAIAVFK